MNGLSSNWVTSAVRRCPRPGDCMKTGPASTDCGVQGGSSRVIRDARGQEDSWAILENAEARESAQALTREGCVLDTAGNPDSGRERFPPGLPEVRREDLGRARAFAGGSLCGPIFWTGSVYTARVELVTDCVSACASVCSAPALAPVGFSADQQPPPGWLCSSADSAGTAWTPACLSRASLNVTANVTWRLVDIKYHFR